jgi:NAD(P)-dependent dehydrogenase (short-subunit alcohol dehydrogenase family)
MKGAAMATPTVVYDLSGQSALVTGATSGIGKAAAVQLALQGADVIVHGRDAGRGADVVNEIAAAGGRARFVAADLAEPDQVAQLAEAAGDVDILINNAGFSWFGSTSDLSPEVLDDLFGANVQSVYLLVAALAPKMVANGGGVIVNVSSMVATIGIAGAAAYSATKAALAAFTRCWAAEYSPHGVRVIAVAPGPVYTGGTATERIAALGDTTLLGRAAEPSEIGEIIGFLASPRAGYITGAIVPVDGGRTAV